MEKKEVWIFGDSFATSIWNSDVPYIWPRRLAEKYNVSTVTIWTLAKKLGLSKSVKKIRIIEE